MKKFIAWSLVVTVLFSNVCFAAPKTTKTESVFINLGYYGDVEQINVYNSCDVYGGSEIKDFGDYEEISNLSNKNEAKTGENGERVWDVSGLNNFSYIGKVNNSFYSKVPWSFDVSYKLNGVPTNPSDLLHKSGVIEIDVDIKANENATEYYKNNYMLEITSSFDMDEFLSVESDEAMFVSKGNTKTLMFIVLPGQSTDFSIRIGSDDFEMDGLTFAMIPLEGDMLDKISDVIKDKQDFEDAFDAINESTDIVLYAMKGMSSGMNEMKEGLTSLKRGSDKLHELSDKRDESIKNLTSAIEDLKGNVDNGKSDLENLDNMLDDIMDMAESINPYVVAMSKSIKAIEDDLTDFGEIIEDLPDDLDDIKDTVKVLSELTGDLAKLIKAQDDTKDIDVVGLKQSVVKIENAMGQLSEELKTENLGGLNEAGYAKIGAIGTQVTVVAQELTNVKSVLSEVESLLGDATASQTDMVTRLKALGRQLDKIDDMIDPDDGDVAIDSVDDMEKLMKELRGTLDVASEYTDKILANRSDIPEAIDNLKVALDSMDSMLGATNSLLDVTQSALNVLSSDVYSGSNKTTDGIISITDQMLTITNQADQFIYSKNKAKNAIDNQWNKIDDETNLFKLDTEAKPVSFTSDKNDDTDKVQFLLKLPDIVEVDNSSNDLEASDNTGTLWSRIAALFEKMFGWLIKLFGGNEQ